MGTRCQVQCDGHAEYGGRVTLYHHWDGYPEHMIPVIAKAWEKMKADGEYRDGRSGYVASTLCWADPIQFDIEFENGNELHGDIEWLYTIDSTGKEWKVKVQTVGYDANDNHVIKVAKSGLISTLAKHYSKEKTAVK